MAAVKLKLITFNSESDFLSYLNNNYIPNTAIVFILDTLQIYTHGKRFGINRTGDTINATITIGGTTISGNAGNVDSTSLSGNSIAIGDCSVGGSLGIKSLSSTYLPSITLYGSDNTQYGTLSTDVNNYLYWNGNLIYDNDNLSSLKNPYNLVIKLNSGTTENTNLFTYDGSSLKTIDITPSSIGAASSSHTHDIYVGTTKLTTGNSSTSRLEAGGVFSLGLYTDSNLYTTFPSGAILLNTSNGTVSVGAITVKASGVAWWQLAGCSGSTYSTSWYLRSGNDSTTSVWYTLLHSGNTSISNGTITINGSSISVTDNKVLCTLANTTKAYITGTSTGSTNTGSLIFDSGVYLSTTAGELVATKFTGALSGNATTATTLLTSRTINGTSFNGSANITTTKWGTARNMYVADYTFNHAGIAMSVDGSDSYYLRMPSIANLDILGSAASATDYLGAKDYRSGTPSSIGGNRLVLSFTLGSNFGVDETYMDLLYISSYQDSTGGDDNAILFGKSTGNMYRSHFTFLGSSWGTAIKIIDTSNISTYIPSINGSTTGTFWAPTSSGTSGLVLLSGGSSAPSWSTVDTTVTSGSTNLITSGGVYSAIDNAKLYAGALNNSSFKLYLVGAMFLTLTATTSTNSNVYITASGSVLHANNVSSTNYDLESLGSSVASMTTPTLTSGTFSNTYVSNGLYEKWGKIVNVSFTFTSRVSTTNSLYQVLSNSSRTSLGINPAISLHFIVPHLSDALFSSGCINSSGELKLDSGSQPALCAGETITMTWIIP